MKRKLGRFFARVSGVLRRVWRWFLPTPARTEVQLAPPRPEEPQPTVTREVIDLEFEEIRAALAAEPSVNAAAPEAPRRSELRPIDRVRLGEPPPVAETTQPAVTVVAPRSDAPEVPQVESAPAYKAPKYGREPKTKVKIAAPRPAAPAPPGNTVANPTRQPHEAATPLEDSAVADLIARVDMFMNMGDIPTAPPESVVAIEPQLLVEEPTLRQQIVEQLLAERMASPEPTPAMNVEVLGDLVSAVAEYEPAPSAPLEVAPVEPSVEIVMAAEEALAADDDRPFVTEEASAADGLDAKIVAEAAEAVAGDAQTHVGDVEAVAGGPVTAARDIVVGPVALSSVLEGAMSHEPPVEAPALETAAAPDVVEERVVEVAAASDPALEAPGVEVAAVSDPTVEEPLVETASAPDPALEESVVDVAAASEAAVEAPVVEAAVAPEPAVEGPVVAEAVLDPAVEVPGVAAAVASEPAVEEPRVAAAVLEAAAEEPSVEVVAAAEEPGFDAPPEESRHATASLESEPMGEEPAAGADVPSDVSVDGDAAIDAELAAAMAQADDANTAFATTHPEAADEVATTQPAVDDEERIEDEAWSPPPVMAEAYYEYDMPPAPEAEEPAAGGGIDATPLADAGGAPEPLPEGAMLEHGDGVAPREVTDSTHEETLPLETAQFGDESPSDQDLSEATLEAVAAAVEETLAAGEPREAATEVRNPLSADANTAGLSDATEVSSAADEDPPAAPVAFRNPIPKVETPNDYIATPESMHALYQLQLDGFEGPLDLLLHLIKRHHLDIFDIPIAFICERYLEYLKAMEDVDIDVASEFLFMAAELLQLKSRMLLPRPEGETPEEDDIDPRAELVRRLLEYQKYKDVAERFGLLDRFGRDRFGRDAEPTPPPEGEAPLKEVGLFALVKAFQACLDRQKPEVRHQVMLEQVSVRQRIRTLVQRFESQEPMSFESLLEDAKRRIDIVVTFLALLEMGKLKLLRIFQNEEGVIYVHPKFDDVSLAFARLEGLDESQYAG